MVCNECLVIAVAENSSEQGGKKSIEEEVEMRTDRTVILNILWSQGKNSGGVHAPLTANREKDLNRNIIMRA